MHCSAEPIPVAEARLRRHCELRKYREKAKTWFDLCLHRSDAQALAEPECPARRLGKLRPMNRAVVISVLKLRVYSRSSVNAVQSENGITPFGAPWIKLPGIRLP